MCSAASSRQNGVAVPLHSLTQLLVSVTKRKQFLQSSSSGYPANGSSHSKSFGSSEPGHFNSKDKVIESTSSRRWLLLTSSPSQLFYTLSTYIGMMIPGYAATLTEQVRVFLEHPRSVGSFVFLAMLFFSSIAFTVLESAMSVIFFHRVRTQRRHFLLSAIIPYAYIFLIGLGILLVSFIAGAIETHSGRQLVILGWVLSLEGSSFVALYVIGRSEEHTSELQSLR